MADGSSIWCYPDAGFVDSATQLSCPRRFGLKEVAVTQAALYKGAALHTGGGWGIDQTGGILALQGSLKVEAPVMAASRGAETVWGEVANTLTTYDPILVRYPLQRFSFVQGGQDRTFEPSNFCFLRLGAGPGDSASGRCLPHPRGAEWRGGRR